MNVPPRSRGSASVQAEHSFLARQVLLPVQPFIHTAGKSSLVLLAAAIVALGWANSPWSGTYFAFWETHLDIEIGFLHISESLREWVNDALMTIFFFVVGLEVKHELVSGELSSRRRATLPLVAALGGMVVPAGLYVALNLGGEATRGWGIPMATDIAFALGILSLLGNRIPSEARVFLLALAIADDIGSILVIALFYTDNLSFVALGIALLLFGVIFAMNRSGLRNVVFYIIVGSFLWFAVLESGVHATIAGVALGALTPARPYFGVQYFERSISELVNRYRELVGKGESVSAEATLGHMEELITGTESPAERLERLTAPWTSYLILPVFALANAGVALTGETTAQALSSSVTLGVLLGLFIGKPLGIVGFSWIAAKLGIVSLPPNLTLKHLFGAGMLAGIGFTVALFITELAFVGSALNEDAKIGVLVASLLAGVTGYVFLLTTTKSPDGTSNDSPTMPQDQVE